MSPEPGSLPLPDGRRIPASAVAISASRSGGPGGQHVNTSSTRVELRVPVDALPLGPEEKALVRARLGGRIGADDALRVTASTERSQSMNRALAGRRLAALVAAAIRTDPTRVPSRPSAAALRRRRAEREAQSARKRERRDRPDPND